MNLMHSVNYFIFMFRSTAKSDTGKSTLSKQFKLCAPLKTDDDTDKLVDWLANIYLNLAMVNYPYPNSFLAPLPGHPVREFCSRIRDKKDVRNSDNDLLEILNHAVELYTNYTGKTICNSINVTSVDLGEKGWDFQVSKTFLLTKDVLKIDCFPTFLNLFCRIRINSLLVFLIGKNRECQVQLEKFFDHFFTKITLWFFVYDTRSHI